MDAQKITHMLYESFANDDLCEHPEIVDDVEDLADEYEDTKAENAELRELVKDMWQTISRNDGCGWDMDANCCTSDECNVSCRYWYRMKELGIEAE